MEMERTVKKAKETKSIALIFEKQLQIIKDNEDLKNELCFREDFNLIDAFRLFDEKEAGKIKQFELKAALEKLGVIVPEKAIFLFFERYDRNNDGYLR